MVAINSIHTWIREAEELGLRFRPDGEFLTVRGNGDVIESLSHVIRERKPEIISALRTRCDRCGSFLFIEVPIHNGCSTRRDCADCERFIDFPLWHGAREA